MKLNKEQFALLQKRMHDELECRQIHPDVVDARVYWLNCAPEVLESYELLMDQHHLPWVQKMLPELVIQKLES